MRKLVTFFSFFFIFSVLGCDGKTSSSTYYTPKTDLEKIFYDLKNNNFTIEYSDNFIQSASRNQKFYYTEYSFQSDGDFGFIGLAQDENCIFKYTIEDNEIVSGAPLIDYNTGVRYQSIYDHNSSVGMENFDIYDLPKEKNDEGYYIYEFGVNEKNDRIILPVTMRLAANSLPPKKLKIKIVKDTILFEAINNFFDLDGDGIEESKSTITSTIYDIGKTENKEIKKYLEDGKSSKSPLDMRFYKFFTPYLANINYTVDFDATQMKNNLGYQETFKMREYCTENAILDVQGTSNRGYMLNQGYVNQFVIQNDKIEIIYTAQNSDGEFLTSLYGEYMTYTLNDLSFNDLIGYQDEHNSNIYYLTDSYLVYIFSYVCYNEVYETNYCDKVKIEIINEETHEFIAYFDMYNKNTNRDLGTYTAHFFNLNNTSIPEVDEYYSFGDNPYTQSQSDLTNILNKFSNHNYSMDVPTGGGMAKYYFTNNYFYAEVYGNQNNNFGFIKENDSIYEFLIIDNEVIVDKSIDYTETGLTLPGIGSSFLSGDDFGFISSINSSLLEPNNYSINTIYNQDYWKINDNSLSNQIFKYYMPYSDIVNNGVGIIFKDDEKNTKLSFLTAFITKDGSIKGYEIFTYYNIGNTSHTLIENYLGNF